MILRMGVPATRKLRGFSDSPDPSRSAHNRRISSAADGVVCDPPPSSTATKSSMESRQPLSKVSRIAGYPKVSGREETHADVPEDSADAGLGVLAHRGLGPSRLSADQRFRK